MEELKSTKDFIHDLGITQLLIVGSIRAKLKANHNSNDEVEFLTVGRDLSFKDAQGRIIVSCNWAELTYEDANGVQGKNVYNITEANIHDLVKVLAILEYMEARRQVIELGLIKKNIA